MSNYPYAMALAYLNYEVLNRVIPDVVEAT